VISCLVKIRPRRPVVPNPVAAAHAGPQSGAAAQTGEGTAEGLSSWRQRGQASCGRAGGGFQVVARAVDHRQRSLGRDRSETRETRAHIAKLLFDAGADAKECVENEQMPGGKFSVLSAAAWHTASLELVELLLDAGVELEPPGATAGPPAPPLVSAAMGGDLKCVERLIQAKPPSWQAREALEVAIAAGDSGMAGALLTYGAHPDQAGRWAGRNGGCLHAALMLGRDTAFVELLIAGGASVKSRDRDGRSPLEVAVQLGADEAAAVLRKHGASEQEIDSRDRLVGACVRGDAALLESLLAGEPELAERCRPSDVQVVCWAARNGKTAALERLLEVGLAPSTVDDDGQTALHLAIARADVKAVEALVRHGASAKPFVLGRLSSDGRTARPGRRNPASRRF